MRTKNQLLTLLSATALLAGSLLTLGTTNAAAADWTFEKHAGTGDGDFSATVRNPNGTRAGALVWNPDPGCCGIPGDAFQVLDMLSDSWGVEARMAIPNTGRKATTRGHEAPYTSPWNTGNIKEGDKVAIQLCVVRGNSEHCSVAYTGHA